MSPTERQKRMSLLARQNTARREYPNYREEMSGLIGAEIADGEVLDLPTTDQLYSEWLSTWSEQERENNVLRKRWQFGEKESWIAACRCLGTHLGTRPVSLMIGAYGYCGAIQTSAKQALMEPLALLEHDRGEIRIKSLKDESGVCVDWFEEGHDQYFIEVIVWGKWCKIVRSCIAASE